MIGKAKPVAADYADRRRLRTLPLRQPPHQAKNELVGDPARGDGVNLATKPERDGERGGQAAKS